MINVFGETRTSGNLNLHSVKLITNIIFNYSIWDPPTFSRCSVQPSVKGYSGTGWCLGGPVVRWSGGPVVPWSGGPVVRWSGGVVVWWSGDLVVRLSSGLVVWWSGGPLVWWSGGLVVRWSGGPVVRWAVTASGHGLAVTGTGMSHRSPHVLVGSPGAPRLSAPLAYNPPSAARAQCEPPLRL